MIICGWGQVGRVWLIDMFKYLCYCHCHCHYIWLWQRLPAVEDQHTNLYQSTLISSCFFSSSILSSSLIVIITLIVIVIVILLFFVIFFIGDVAIHCTFFPLETVPTIASGSTRALNQSTACHYRPNCNC